MDRDGLVSIGLGRRQTYPEGKDQARRRFETEYLTKEGAKVSVEVSAHTFRFHGRTVTMSIVRDITERKHAEARIQYLAWHDDLTGLNNRVFFERELKQLLMCSRTCP